LEGLRPRTRGRKPQPQNPLAKKVAQLERENRRLERRLKQAEIIIDVQKKVSQILAGPLSDESTGDDE
jgi:cell shape-determining protein MreC